MRQWLKCQFQSRNLEKKLIFLLLSIGLISIQPLTYGQEDLGLLVEQQKIIFEVGKDSKIHVKHVVETGKWSDNQPRIIEILPGSHSNLWVADEDGDRLGHSFEGETFEESKYIILKQKLGNYDLIAEYDLDNFMEYEKGKWMKHLEYDFDIIVMFDEDIELIFANSRPVETTDARGINCVGCNLVLEYFDAETTTVSKEIIYKDKKFNIEILSDGEVSELEFFGGGKEVLNFKTENSEQIFVLKIPFELFLNPYDVYFTENDDKELDQVDKIRKSEFSQDEKHVKLSFKTLDEGVISIVGATLEEHERKLSQIEKTKQLETEKQIIEKEKKGIAVPIPGEKSVNSESEFERNQVMKAESQLSFADELNDKPVITTDGNNSIIFIIIAIIAAIVIGIVIKIKKN